MAKGGEFERILLKTINDVLLEIFGENATSIIYGYIEKNYSLTQQNIAVSYTHLTLPTTERV